jgi:ABC-type transport system involved in multi-copper enzyme maturation permease subunit
VIDIRNIFTVAKYESKTLYRSWFFRLFSIIAILFLFGINMGMFVDHSGAQWSTRAIAANLPYINVLFINVAQAIIAVFLASDFLKRDKKLDTTEVIYARPISNGEYVLGKTLGILFLFVGLVILILLMTLVFNLISKDTPVVWQAYLYYPLLITVPTLIFILGLSFFLMILFKSQAVTFIVLLGYIGLTLFYFKDKLYGSLDYMAFNLPMVYSDFIQFADPEKILIQRLAYLFMGTGFIFATIRFLNRLPQTGRWNLVNLFAFIGFVLLGGGMGYKYYSGHQQISDQREEYLELNNRYAEDLIVDVLSNDLHVLQDGVMLEVRSDLRVENQNERKLDTLIFSLNPGFSVDSIISNDGSVEFVRTKQLILVLPEEGIAASEEKEFTLFYKGEPDEAVAYLDIRKKNLEALKYIQVATIDKKPGIVDENFLLLTPELLWYPISGVGFNLKTFLPSELDFTRFSLSVELDTNMTAIAPGAVTRIPGFTHFEPETELNAYSLVIGPFEQRSITIDDVEYNLYIKPDHDYFSKFFPLISDSLDVMITEAKDDYETSELDLYYPFKRINIVEVPIQYHAYERPYIQSVETIQPEMIFFPEKGAGIATLDFSRYLKQSERRGRDNDQQRSPREMEEELFKRFLRATFFRSETRMFGGGRGGGGDELITFQSESNYSRNPYCVFPLYYSYVTGISSREYSVFNSMLELYLKEGYEVSPRQGFSGGITSNERANLALQKRSMIEIFGNWNTNLISSLISQAGGFVILALKNKVGMIEFDDFLYYYLEDHAFTEISFTQFAADFEDEFGLEIEPYLKFINSSGEAPSFLVSTPEFIQTRDEISEVYLVRMKITNTGDATGMVDIVFRMPGQGGFGGGGSMDTEERLYELLAGETKDVQITLYDQPRMMTVNTLISANIPSSFNVFLRSPANERINDLEEYEKISDEPVSLVFNNEYVVDNEDEGFSYVSVSNESKLKQYIDSRKTKDDDIHYRGISSYWTPAVWTPTAHSAFYGESVRSALVCRNGDGQNTARWSTLLPEAGFYDVYMYVPVSAMYKPPSRGGRSRGGGGDRGDRSRRGGGPEFADQGTKYPYVISSNEGIEELEFTLNKPEEGWNKIGTFHFPADTATIQLSNNTEGSRIFADAIKWVRRID